MRRFALLRITPFVSPASLIFAVPHFLGAWRPGKTEAALGQGTCSGQTLYPNMQAAPLA
jgi:hypothetical protein